MLACQQFKTQVMQKMSKRDIQLNIRVTQELKDKIEESAKRNNRSINAEAITLMEEALSGKQEETELIHGDMDFKNLDTQEFANILQKKQKELMSAITIFAELISDKKNKDSK